MVDSASTRVGRFFSAPGLLFWILAALLSANLTLYLAQPDWAFALTIYSPWMPAAAGFFLTIFSSLAKRSKPLFFLAVIWVGWGLFASEELHSLVARAPSDVELHSFRYDSKWIRVVSLNCAGGSIEAAREVKAWSPDLVLLQETPSQKELAPLAKELYGPKAGLLVGPDCAILSRYPLRPLMPAEGQPGPSNFVLAFVEGPEGRWLVASVRLQPPVLRFDYWSLDCWRAYAEGKRRRREELSELMAKIHQYDDLEPMIVGGDFNAPPDRSIQAIMSARGGFSDYPLLDAAKEAGTGWTMTAVNDAPLVRVDQIWLDARFPPLRTLARKTNRSDHRMVVSDVMIKP